MNRASSSSGTLADALVEPARTKRSYVVSLHDVAPSTAEASRRWVEVLERFGIKVSLLVVPGKWNGLSLDDSPEFVNWLHECQRRGHEIVQHGYRHQRLDSFNTGWWRESRGRVQARGCEEFWHLPAGVAEDLMGCGLIILRAHDFTPSGFIAPGWLMSEGSVKAAVKLGFHYTCTLSQIVDLRGPFRRRAFTTSQRPQSSLSGPGLIWNRMLVSVNSRFMTTTRVSIHPNDLRETRLRESNLELCRMLKQAGFVNETYAQCVHRMGQS